MCFGKIKLDQMWPCLRWTSLFLGKIQEATFIMYLWDVRFKTCFKLYDDCVLEVFHDWNWNCP